MKKILFLLLSMLLLTGCGSKKNDNLTGVYLTYSEGACYMFVNPETEEPFFATLPESIKDSNGKEIKEVNNGDVIEFPGAKVKEDNIYSVKDAIRVKKGNVNIVKKYHPLIKPYINPMTEESGVPMAIVEIADIGAESTTKIMTSSFKWTYKDLDGKEQVTQSSEAEDLQPSVVAMNSDQGEVILHFSKEPTTIHMFEDGQQIEVSKEDDGYHATMNKGHSYHIKGTWKNGYVEYKFTSESTTR